MHHFLEQLPDDISQMIPSIQTLARRFKRTAEGNIIDRPVFFLHVPKCGGTSVNVALREAYGLRSGMRVDLRGNVHHEAFYWLDAAASKSAADAMQVPLHEHREHILIHEMSRSHKKYISGHFQFSEVAHRTYHDTYAFITILRDPVERWYSTYFYNRDKTSDHFAIKDTLENYVQSASAQSTGNLITHSFAGSDRSTDTMVASAIENLAKFDVVGVLEDLGAFKRDLRYVLGADIDIPIRNTSPTPAHQRRKEITPDIHRKVVALCRQDREVYDYVANHLIGTSRAS